MPQLYFYQYNKKSIYAKYAYSSIINHCKTYLVLQLFPARSAAIGQSKNKQLVLLGKICLTNHTPLGALLFASPVLYFLLLVLSFFAVFLPQRNKEHHSFLQSSPIHHKQPAHFADGCDIPVPLANKLHNLLLISLYYNFFVHSSFVFFLQAYLKATAMNWGIAQFKNFFSVRFRRIAFMLSKTIFRP